MQLTPSECPIHSNGGAGHDSNFPLFTSMPLANCVQKMVDKCDCDGRKGRVEIYVCGALIESGVWKVMMKRQTSWILIRRIESSPYSGLESLWRADEWPVLTLSQRITLRRHGAPIGTIPIMLSTSIQNNGYNPSKNPFNFPNACGSRSPLWGEKQRWFDQ